MIHRYGIQAIQRTPRQQLALEQFTRFEEHELSYLRQWDEENDVPDEEAAVKNDDEIDKNILIDTELANQVNTKEENSADMKLANTAHSEPVNSVDIETLKLAELVKVLNAKFEKQTTAEPENSIDEEPKNPIDTKPENSFSTESTKLTVTEIEKSTNAAPENLFDVASTKLIDTKLVKSTDMESITSEDKTSSCSLLASTLDGSCEMDDKENWPLKSHLVPNPAFCSQNGKLRNIQLL